ncbi:UDP-N-acetylmuramoyl-L-alanyl-D-glutamate--2,6-diaminopimelate ligase [Jeotgalibacillus campisalis]|uniref:UDP-N-acetylmuramoylalanyl-D-glutamate--2, 6-diaminopimelate ligase n=1 Tax=Jeotgalibacillus campisalis TaxID=220754 RepID=A0A0C2VYW5_9BACL|nr:UDP-N-acetylmuramoyl-L-alanyl-D-glutamate--2,6-diaminopimelate ligase [Jeotgalibacillus campisalis]KIL49143.1 UDP-N-acetylmuramoylalanyl-D-glutamate--2,6-diaminopimelate ligase [Jeotgalibacillus campisalis]
MNTQDFLLNKIGLLRQYGTLVESITSIAFDSRNIINGSAFFCIKGENADGHDFIVEAIENGAILIAGTDADQFERLNKEYPACTFLLVQDVRYAMAHFSIYFYNQVHQSLQTIGVTGTNGKTTVATFVRSLLTQLAVPTGSIGTNGICSSKGQITFKKSTPTTPEAPDLHHIFQLLSEEQDQAAVMEVSSIAIDQKRVEGIHFDIAIHTNLSPEHLEYHKTFQHYKEAKMKLFKQASRSIINYDDAGMGKDLIDASNGELMTYSLDRSSGADLIADKIHVTEEGTRFELIYQNRSYIVHSTVFGDYNVANLLTAIGVGLFNGFTIEKMLPVLEKIENPAGRFQVIDQYGERKIILDYAHTPVALEKLVEEAKKLDYRKLIVMIAGIGIRDFNKMPLMAQTIEGKADKIVVTVDHPGFFDPKKIVNQVMSGFSDQESPNIYTSLTREEGVKTSLELSGDEDIIILTSGCINGAQLVKGEEIPHSDEDIIHDYFSEFTLIGEDIVGTL